MAGRSNSMERQGLKPLFFEGLNVAAEEVAEKVGSGRILVAQALRLCALLDIQRIHQSDLSQKAHRQSACATFSAACEAATHKVDSFDNFRKPRAFDAKFHTARRSFKFKMTKSQFAFGGSGKSSQITTHEAPVTSHHLRLRTSRHRHIHGHAGVARHRGHPGKIGVHPQLPFAIELQRSCTQSLRYFGDV
jgi:hypothetical protein